MTHDTAKHIQLLVPGIFFGYTFDTVAGTYAQLFYCGAGVYFRPCNEKDVNFSKYFDEKLTQCKDMAEVRTLLKTTSFVDTELLDGLDFLIASKHAELSKDAKNDPCDDCGYVVQGVMIGFIYDDGDECFKRVYYTQNKLFSIPCPASDVNLNYFLNGSLLDHEGCSDLREAIVQYSKVDIETLLATDIHTAEQFRLYDVFIE